MNSEWRKTSGCNHVRGDYLWGQKFNWESNNAPVIPSVVHCCGLYFLRNTHHKLAMVCSDYSPLIFFQQRQCTFLQLSTLVCKDK